MIPTRLESFDLLLTNVTIGGFRNINTTFISAVIHQLIFSSFMSIFAGRQLIHTSKVSFPDFPGSTLAFCPHKPKISSVLRLTSVPVFKRECLNASVTCSLLLTGPVAGVSGCAGICALLQRLCLPLAARTAHCRVVSRCCRNTKKRR